MLQDLDIEDLGGEVTWLEPTRDIEFVRFYDVRFGLITYACLFSSGSTTKVFSCSVTRSYNDVLVAGCQMFLRKDHAGINLFAPVVVLVVVYFDLQATPDSCNVRYPVSSL